MRWKEEHQKEIERKRDERKAKTEADRARKAAVKQQRRIAQYGIRDQPGTVLLYDAKKKDFVHEDGTEQPKANELPPETPHLASCDRSYYLEAALVDSISGSSTGAKELVILDSHSHDPLVKAPKLSPTQAVKKALSRFLASRSPPKPKQRPRKRAVTGMQACLNH